MLWISVLVVRDNELDVRDNEVASSGVAEVWNAREKHWGRGSVSRPQFTGGTGLENTLFEL